MQTRSPYSTTSDMRQRHELRGHVCPRRRSLTQTPHCDSTFSLTPEWFSGGPGAQSPTATGRCRHLWTRARLSRPATTTSALTALGHGPFTHDGPLLTSAAFCDSIAPAEA